MNSLSRGNCVISSNKTRQSCFTPPRRAITVNASGASEKVRLGNSDLIASKCCLGTMTWGEQNTEAEAHQQLNYAFENGINFLDTAEIYPVPPNQNTQGQTDRFISTWLKEQNRADIILASKVSGYGRQTYLRKGGVLPRVNEANIVESVDSSLARLGTDYIDLLQVHWPDRYVPLFGGAAYDVNSEREGDISFEEQLKGLETVIKQGKVRYIGVSNETSYGVMKFITAAEQLGLPRIQTIQNSYSLLVRGAFETDLAEVCAPRQGNVGLLAYSPLAGGALSGKYIQGNTTAGGEDISKSRFNLFQGYMQRYTKSLAREATEKYVEVAKKHNLTPTQLALGWCRSRWFVASTIIGATTMKQLKENVEAFDVVLDADVLADIDAVYRRYRDPAFN
jgi:aryl-alcohol dehydrogenase-like predicted oxidoreductase